MNLFFGSCLASVSKKPGSAVVFDSNAQAFITAVGTLSAPQQTAVNNLVVGLKADSVWSLLTHIYPLVGGTALAHSYNLVNPATNPITWLGTVTHNGSGATIGSGGAGDTGRNANTFPGTTHSMGAYVSTVSSNGLAYLIGASTANHYIKDNSGSNNVGTAIGNATAANATDAGRVGFYVGTRSGPNLTLYRHGGVIGGASTGAGAMPSANIYLGAVNGGGFVLNAAIDASFGFFFLGGSLDATQAGNLHTRVQAFQTALSRAIP